MIADYFGFNMGTRDIEEIFSDLDLKEKHTIFPYEEDSRLKG